jgi:hypothetical protein
MGIRENFGTCKKIPSDVKKLLVEAFEKKKLNQKRYLVK